MIALDEYTTLQKLQATSFITSRKKSIWRRLLTDDELTEILACSLPEEMYSHLSSFLPNKKPGLCKQVFLIADSADG